VNDNQKTKSQLIEELQKLRQNVSKLEQSQSRQISAEQTEKILFEPEATFRSFVEASTDLFVRLNKKGYIEFISPRVKDLYGYEVDELVGKHLKKTTPLKEVPKALAALKSVFKGKILRNFQINQVAKSGQIIPMEINAIPVKKDGKIIRFQGVLRDISERKQIENKIINSEEKFRVLTENSPIGIYYNKLNGDFVYGNKKAEEIVGYKREELIGKNFLDLKLLNKKEIIKGAKLLALNKLGKSTGPDLFTLNRKDGTKKQVEISTEIINIGNEKVVLGMVRDLTEYKQAITALFESEKLLRDVLDASPYSIFVKDKEGKYILVNKKMADSHNTTPENLMGKTDISIAKKWLKTAEQKKKFREQENAVIDQNKKLLIKEEKFTFLDGTERWYQTIKIPISVKDNPNCLLGVSLDITERIKAEESTLASKKMLDDVLNTIPVRVFWKDLEGNYLGCNQLFANDAGRKKPEDLIGDNDFNMGWVEQAELYRNDDKLVIETGTPKINYEEPQSTPEGNTIWLRTSKFPLRDKEGLIYGVLGTYEDITKQKKAEEALEESERRFRSTVESSPMGMHFYQLTEKNRLVFTGANPAADSLLNVDNSVFIGKTIEEAFPSLMNTEIPEKYKHVAKTGEIWNSEQLEYEDNKVKGAFEIVAFQTEPNCIVSMFNEITDKKKAQEALLESEKKFRTLIEQSNDAIYLLRDDKFEVINSKFSEMFGYSLKECQSKNFNFRQLIAPKSIPIVEKRISQHKEGKEIKPVYEFTSISKDGKEIECEVCTSHIEYKGGHAVQGILRDITERKQAEEEKAILEEQLRRAQKLETIGTLAGGIAHDFNNILAPIMGYTDMALLSLNKTDPLFNDLQHVLKGAHRAKELVEQILLFSKQSEKERKPLAIQSLVKEALKLLRPSIPTTIEIKQYIDNTCSKVQADATQIHQIIVNLCTNAWQAMEEEGGILTIELIELELDQATAKLYPNLNEDRYVRLSISDTGPGIDEETLERIFEPFYTTKTVNKGTGLGLSVVHGIVSSHKGDIHVVSKPGKGSIFHVYIPTIKSEETITLKESTELAKGSEYVMVVDDEIAIGDLIKKILENFGYKTEVYNSGLTAFEAFKQEPKKFDLLITDLTMPQMTGLDLADQIHQINAKLPVMIMTGFGDSITSATQKRYGVKQVLGKPVVIEELTTAIRKVLDK